SRGGGRRRPKRQPTRRLAPHPARRPARAPASPVSPRAPSACCGGRSRRAGRRGPMRRPRLLPVLAAASALLLSTKLADLWLAVEIAPPAAAQAQSQAPAAQKTASAAPQAPGTRADHTPAAGAETPATQVADRDPTQFSPQEIKLLQALSKRRDELDQRSGEID